MLHDGDLEDAQLLADHETVEQVPVNRQEYEKFCYLIKVMDAIDRAHDIGKRRLVEMRTEGAQGYVDVDWHQVTRHVAPQLHVVFLQDRERDGFLQQFIRFPAAVVIARTAYVVDLDSRFELSLEGNDAHQDVASAANALRSLESYVQSLEGGRQVDAQRNLRQLVRVLKIEL